MDVFEIVDCEPLRGIGETCCGGCNAAYNGDGKKNVGGWVDRVILGVGRLATKFFVYMFVFFFFRPFTPFPVLFFKFCGAQGRYRGWFVCCCGTHLDGAVFDLVALHFCDRSLSQLRGCKPVEGIDRADMTAKESEKQKPKTKETENRKQRKKTDG